MRRQIQVVCTVCQGTGDRLRQGRRYLCQGCAGTGLLVKESGSAPLAYLCGATSLQELAARLLSLAEAADARAGEARLHGEREQENLAAVEGATFASVGQAVAMLCEQGFGQGRSGRVPGAEGVEVFV